MSISSVSTSHPASYLDILVDGSLVKAVYLIKREEGIIAHWPPHSLDAEALAVGENLSVPMRQGLYIVLGGDELLDKYVGLVLGRGVLLLRLASNIPVEEVGERLSRTYLVFRKKSRRASSGGLGEEEEPGGEGQAGG